MVQDSDPRGNKDVIIPTAQGMRDSRVTITQKETALEEHPSKADPRLFCRNKQAEILETEAIPSSLSLLPCLVTPMALSVWVAFLAESEEEWHRALQR